MPQNTQNSQEVIEADTDISEYRENVEEIMDDKQAFKDLARHTFDQLDKENIPKALLEGQMKGFDIQDFMKGNVYALPFWNSKENRQEYSLAVSIDYMRKVAMRSGQTGKSEPKFTTDENGELESCKVTVWKKHGHEKGFTAKVYFDEYDTGRNLWKEKPRTMIAKVAEMHALRMAFPEELQNHYIGAEKEKDLGKANNDSADVKFDEPEWKEEVDEIESIDELKDYYKDNKGRGKNFAKYVSKRKQELKNNQSQDEDS